MALVLLAILTTPLPITLRSLLSLRGPSEA